MGSTERLNAAERGTVLFPPGVIGLPNVLKTPPEPIRVAAVKWPERGMKTSSRGQGRVAVVCFESGRSAADEQAMQAFRSGSQYVRTIRTDYGFELCRQIRRHWLPSGFGDSAVDRRELVCRDEQLFISQSDANEGLRPPRCTIRLNRAQICRLLLAQCLECQGLTIGRLAMLANNFGVDAPQLGQMFRRHERHRATGSGAGLLRGIELHLKIQPPLLRRREFSLSAVDRVAGGDSSGVLNEWG
jgi:hypothetical protein